MSAPAEITTADQLLTFTDPTCRCELVNGKLIRMPFNDWVHGRVAANIAFVLGRYVVQSSLGDLFASGTGFLIERNPDSVRAPDVAFVRRDRSSLIEKSGFFPGHPDLAIEVLSPNDTASEVLAKVDQWLATGTGEVWVADPVRETIAIHSADHPTRTFGVSDRLSESVVLPGFSMSLADVYR